MKKRKFLTLVRLALALAAIFWVVGQCLAQMGGGQSAAQTSKFRSPQAPWMRMRSMTNAQRQAAAQRNAARRAEALQRARATANSQGEVKK